MTHIKATGGPAGSQPAANAASGAEFSAVAADLSRGKPPVAPKPGHGNAALDRGVYSQASAGRPDNGRSDKGSTRTDSHSGNHNALLAPFDDYASSNTSGTGGMNALSGKRGRGKLRSAHGRDGESGSPVEQLTRQRERKGQQHKRLQRDTQVRQPEPMKNKPVKLRVAEQLLFKIIKRDMSKFLAASPASGLFSAGARPFTTDANRGSADLGAMPPNMTTSLWGKL